MSGYRRPVAGDHDPYDIRNANGSEMSDDEYDEFKDLVEQHKRLGSEGLIRFAPWQPVRFVYAETPLSRRRS